MCLFENINEIKSYAFLTHGHTLQLPVGETIKAIKIIRGTLNATSELSKFIKYSMV